MNIHLLNPEYLKNLCKKYGLAPSKKYGQNFLINPEPIEKMISAAAISGEDTVVEIGPGFGVLTLALAEKAKKVIAFEIEKKLMPYWQEKIKENKNIEIVWGNVLRECGRLQSVGEPYKLAANLPYQITSEAIRKFLEAEKRPELMVLMVQKEVAERICARPGEMSVLSVSVQYYADPEIVAPVPRSYFWPAPKVDSAVIRIVPNCHSRESGNPDDCRSVDSRFRGNDSAAATDNFFFKTVKAGFASRRKFLIKNLEFLAGKKNRGELAKIFAEIDLSAKVRAQELSVQEWVELAGRIGAYLSV